MDSCFRRNDRVGVGVHRRFHCLCVLGDLCGGGFLIGISLVVARQGVRRIENSGVLLRFPLTVEYGGYTMYLSQIRDLRWYGTSNDKIVGANDDSPGEMERGDLW
jgi:hypothetical protein